MNARISLIALAIGCTLLVVLLAAKVGIQPFALDVRFVSSWSQSAALFFVESITADTIKRDYSGTAVTDPVTGVERPGTAGKLRILIVPGHRPDFGGAEFGGVYERDVVVDIADALAELLRQNPHDEVMVARSKAAWDPTLQSYFDTHAADIEAFEVSQAAQMAAHLSDGSFLPEADQISHLTASSEAALQLYGINKWASEQHYDITIHLHINDYAGRRGRNTKYDGFAVYVPEHQYSNAKASQVLGTAIAARLNAYHATSTLPKESAGVVEDQELIAVGSNNSADNAALLIEYGYIYEPQFQNASILPLAERDYAYQTYLGLQDFLGDPVTLMYGSASLPYDWSQVTAVRGERGPGVYALQAALHYLGYYPTAEDSFSDCPVSGKVGPCTRAAIEAYQRAHGLEATGTLGPQTRAALTSDLATLGNVSLMLR